MGNFFCYETSRTNVLFYNWMLYHGFVRYPTLPLIYLERIQSQIVLLCYVECVHEFHGKLVCRRSFSGTVLKQLWCIFFLLYCFKQALSLFIKLIFTLISCFMILILPNSNWEERKNLSYIPIVEEPYNLFIKNWKGETVIIVIARCCLHSTWLLEDSCLPLE